MRPPKRTELNCSGDPRYDPKAFTLASSAWYSPASGSFFLRKEKEGVSNDIQHDFRQISEGRFSVPGLRAQFQFGAHFLFWKSPKTNKRLAYLVLRFQGRNRTRDHTTLKHLSVTPRARCPFTYYSMMQRAIVNRERVRDYFSFSHGQVQRL